MLVGIGFIVGLDTSLNLFAGSFIASFAIVPLIAYFADFAGSGVTVWNNSALSMNSVGIGVISGNYVRYIGADMMLCGGLIGAIRLIPTIVRSTKEVISARTSGGEKSGVGMLALVVGIVLGFIAAFYISGSIVMAIIGIILALILSMLFVIVSGRLTGIVGTSNLPVSGMTIASMVIMTMIFALMRWTGFGDNRTILLFGTFIVVAISSAGGYVQSHKATFILGGNKNEADRHYLVACIVGVATVIAVIMLLAPQLAITGDGAAFGLPQANLMKTLTEGIMQGNLPWTLILAGVAIALFLFVLKLPIMTIAVGFYLPIATTSAVLLGGLASFVVSKAAKTNEEREAQLSNGVSLSAGLVAGTAIIGLIGIIMQVFVGIGGNGPSGFAAGNGMAYVIAIVLFGTILPILLRLKKEGVYNA